MPVSPALCINLAKEAMDKLTDLAEKNKGGNVFAYFSLSVRRICGIRVNAQLKITKPESSDKLNVLLYIDTQHYDLDAQEELTRLFDSLLQCDFTLEALQQCMSTQLSIIPTLRFHKRTSSLIRESELAFCNDELWDALECDTVEIYGDKCCVCDERTDFQTKCKHCLCIECLNGIKPVVDDEDDADAFEEILCPMCRECICYAP